MKTATYFRAFLETADDIIAWINQPESKMRRRERQFPKLATRILDDLADDSWTRVTDDPKRPMRGICILGAWVNGTNTRVVCASCWDGQRWRSDGPPSELTGWRLYAWQEWPLAPPLPVPPRKPRRTSCHDCGELDIAAKHDDPMPVCPRCRRGQLGQKVEPPQPAPGAPKS